MLVEIANSKKKEKKITSFVNYLNNGYFKQRLLNTFNLGSFKLTNNQTFISLRLFVDIVLY